MFLLYKSDIKMSIGVDMGVAGRGWVFGVGGSGWVGWGWGVGGGVDVGWGGG